MLFRDEELGRCRQLSAALEANETKMERLDQRYVVDSLLFRERGSRHTFDGDSAEKNSKKRRKNGTFSGFGRPPPTLARFQDRELVMIESNKLN